MDPNSPYPNETRSVIDSPYSFQTKESRSSELIRGYTFIIRKFRLDDDRNRDQLRYYPDFP